MLVVMDSTSRVRTADRPARSRHPCHLHDAIYAQPGALRLLGRGNAEALEAAARRLRGYDRLILVGAGSSYHAALAAEPLFATVAGFGHRVRVQRDVELTALPDSALDGSTG